MRLGQELLVLGKLLLQLLFLARGPLRKPAIFKLLAPILDHCWADVVSPCRLTQGDFPSFDLRHDLALKACLILTVLLRLHCHSPSSPGSELPQPGPARRKTEKFSLN